MHMSRHARRGGCLHSHMLELDVPDIDGDVRSLQSAWGAVFEVLVQLIRSRMHHPSRHVRRQDILRRAE